MPVKAKMSSNYRQTMSEFKFKNKFYSSNAIQDQSYQNEIEQDSLCILNNIVKAISEI